MGRKKPHKRSRMDVFDRAERFVAEGRRGDTGPWACLVARAVDAAVLRTDSGSAILPVTWRVVLQEHTSDGAIAMIDPSMTWVLVDDETGEVRADPLVSL